MALNVVKNKQYLLKAWQDVVDDKSAIDWALFGYEGHTFDLKVVSCGDGGLEEIVNEFNSGQIMYAFCRVIDPKTSLPKFVLINWQGECAPGDRKGKCATHLRDVAHFFKGVHLTVNARTEDDVDPSIIIDKVAKSTGSSYSFTDRDGPLQNTLPVGSVYRRTIPAAEINPVERDKFWERTEAEEKVRLEDDRKKTEEVRQRLEEERKRRELAEAKQREEMSKQRSWSISQLRVAEAGACRNDSESVNGKLWEQQLAEDSRDDNERKMRSESLRKQRKQEVESLISQRTINARAVFEQNTIYGNTYTSTEVVERNGSHSPKSTDLQSPSRPNAPFYAGVSQVRDSHSLQSDDWNNDKAHNELVESDSDVPPEHIDNYHEAGDAHIMGTSVPIEMAEDRTASSDYHQDVFVPGQGLKARSIYDYQAADDTEISFNPDDIITNIDQIDEGWWQGLAPDGTYGLFPANYVELMDN